MMHEPDAISNGEEHTMMMAKFGGNTSELSRRDSAKS